MPGTKTRSLRLLASTSLIGLSLAAAPLSVEFSLEQPVLKMAQAKCCFAAGTSILMADGSTRPIESIRLGDLVMGGNGGANRVVEIERPPLGPRRLYALNGGDAFVTAEHPFMTTEGWKAIDPDRTAAENPNISVQRLCLGDSLLVLRPAGKLAALDNLALAPDPSLEAVVLRELRGFDAPPRTPLFNLLLDGDHAYFANRYLVHNKDGDDGGSGGGGGEGGESESGSSGSGSSGSSGSGSGGSGEGGESGSSGSGGGGSGEGGESGSSGSDDSGSSNSGSGKSGLGKSGSSKSGSGGSPFFGDLEQVGPDLSKDEEAAAISKGWQ